MPSLLQRLATDTTDTGKQIVEDTASGLVEASKTQVQDIAGEATLGVLGKEAATPPEPGPAFPDPTQDPELVRAKRQSEKRRRTRLAELQGDLRNLMLRQKQERDQVIEQEAQVRARAKMEEQEKKKKPFDFIARVKSKRESERGRG